jgi:hypothetical protein
MEYAPAIKRLVDLVDRGPEDEDFFPFDSNQTVFRRQWPAAHNCVSEINEIGYQGAAEWGERITVRLTRQEAGDMVQWLAVRYKPQSWLGGDVEARLSSGAYAYADPSGAWMWASSLGSIGIRQVDLQINDVTVESWTGDWIDIWSRMSLDAGRSGTWDVDMNGQLPAAWLSDTTRPPQSTWLPTEDGWITSWLPFSFFRRPGSALPLLALSDQTEVRVHIWFNDFEKVVRRRRVPRVDPCETPLGKTVTLVDVSSGALSVYPMAASGQEPPLLEFGVWVGSVQLENPLRDRYMRQPFEMLYEPVSVTRYDVPPALTLTPSAGALGATVQVVIPLDEFNGPLRSVIWFFRRKAVWQFNEWTNYGALLEPGLLQTIASQNARLTAVTPSPIQVPIMASARLMVGNAVWRDDTEQWWRQDFGLDHRGGVRMTAGMVYGYDFGSAGVGGDLDDLQPEGTVNASRTDLRLDMQVIPPVPSGANQWVDPTGSEYEIIVIGIGLNWMRFVSGQAQPLFSD